MRIAPSSLSTDHYGALQIGMEASQKEVKKAYMKQCLTYHPDKSRANTSELFQCITKAYEVESCSVQPSSA